ncbi:MAG: hypothetical protein HQK77_03975 [Desulfobacterales bacterium]|nr:hypothetical protein [Desulfobacterales bacterium]
MTISTEEVEIRKKAIFDSMSQRNQKAILKKGYPQWDPFEEPKDPIDMRNHKSQRTTQKLIREFLQQCRQEGYSNEYASGAFNLCLGIVNGDEKSKGMYDFSCWYQQVLKQDQL